MWIVTLLILFIVNGVIGLGMLFIAREEKLSLWYGGSRSYWIKLLVVQLWWVPLAVKGMDKICIKKDEPPQQELPLK